MRIYKRLTLVLNITGKLLNFVDIRLISCSYQHDPLPMRNLGFAPPREGCSRSSLTAGLVPSPEEGRQLPASGTGCSWHQYFPQSTFQHLRKRSPGNAFLECTLSDLAASISFFSKLRFHPAIAHQYPLPRRRKRLRSSAS